jgi:hypothetical protein
MQRPRFPVRRPSHPRLGRPRLLGRPVFTLLAALLCALPLTAIPETYYVRTDGGSAARCDGLADRPAEHPDPVDGSCAWQHPFIALPPGGQVRIAGGDTLVIRSGDYRMGLGAPQTGNCHPAYAWDCHMPALPSGPSAGSPTRVIGGESDEGCRNPPTLWGTERAAMVINLQGTQHARLSCLEVTDRSGCIESHCHGGPCRDEILACKREAPPFGHWAPTGLVASDAVDIGLEDLYIHGLASRGILAGRIADWTLERVRVIGNGWAGWDGDIGPDSTNRGRILFRDVEIAYNGCAETWPEGDFVGCWAQGTGGYGDGLGTARTGGQWVFERARIHHNTSDGLDLLYLDEQANVAIEASLFEANAGNQIKSSASTRIGNSVIVGSCAAFRGHGNMLSSDLCRAAGDAIFLGLGPGIDSTVLNSSVTGEGNCLVSSAGEAGGRLRFLNNLFVGQPAHGKSRASCQFYTDAPAADVEWSGNVTSGAHNAVCEAGNRCPEVPGIRVPDLSGFDPTPLQDGPLVHSADESQQRPDGDFRGERRPRDGPWSVGALEPEPRLGSKPDLRDGSETETSDDPSR